MTVTAQSRFPDLAPQGPIHRHRNAIGMSLALIPLPLGEISMLLAAWLLVLQF